MQSNFFNVKGNIVGLRIADMLVSSVRHYALR